MKTTSMIARDFDGYTLSEIESCENMVFNCSKKFNVDGIVSILDEHTYSVILNPLNKVISVSDLQSMEQTLFSNNTDISDLVIIEEE